MTMYAKDGEQPAAPETQLREGEPLGPNGSGAKTLERSPQGSPAGGAPGLVHTRAQAGRPGERRTVAGRANAANQIWLDRQPCPG